MSFFRPLILSLCLAGLAASPVFEVEIEKIVHKIKPRPGIYLKMLAFDPGGANVAANIKEGGPDGVALLASVGVPNKHGGNVLDFNLGGIAIPVLVVHHNDDGCKVTTVTGAKDIKAALTGSKAAELMIFKGGSSGNGKECGAKSHHGFLGLEKKVVNAVSDWIKSH